jgi:hypothetical protein
VLEALRPSTFFQDANYHDQIVKERSEPMAFRDAKNHRLVTLPGNAYGTPWTEVRLAMTLQEPIGFAENQSSRASTHGTGRQGRDMSHEHVAGTESQKEVIGRTLQGN